MDLRDLLTTGRIVEFEGGERGIVIGRYITNGEWGIDIEDYIEEDLTGYYEDDCNIMVIYSVPNVYLYSDLPTILNDKTKGLDLVWTREVNWDKVPKRTKVYVYDKILDKKMEAEFIAYVEDYEYKFIVKYCGILSEFKYCEIVEPKLEYFKK